MKLLEFEAKKILAKYGIHTPKGMLAKSTSEAAKIAARLEAPLVVKAQVPVAGRGKAGGIIFAASPAEVEDAASRLLGKLVKDEPVRSLWIEEKVKAETELYFGVSVDRFRRSYVAVASKTGGVDIEQTAEEAPEKIVRLTIDGEIGFHSFHARQMAGRIGYFGKKLLNLSEIFVRLYRAGLDYDAELIEMNPLAETSEGEFVAADARVIMDDNALFRHQEYREIRTEENSDLTKQEREAMASDLVYVKLNGDIGILGNGAGLVMATLDTISLYGGRPANFLDIGGGATSERIAAALNILLADPDVRILFINILGGITRCDEVASGILKARDRAGVFKPMIIRLVGTNEAEGKKMLEAAGISALESMEEAAKEAVETSTLQGER